MGEKANEIRHSRPFETAIELITNSGLTGTGEAVLCTTEEIAVALKQAYQTGYEKGLEHASQGD